MRHRKLKAKKHGPFTEILFIILSILVSILIARSGAIEQLLTASKNIEFLGSFITGIFFTSLLTLAPATVILGEISQTYNLFYVALFGALGAVIGDLLIFYFIRDSVTDAFAQLFTKSRFKKLFHLARFKKLKWISPIVGAFIIASPLPDELGLALMGLTHVKTKKLILISFIMNFIGVILVGIAARHVK